MQMPYGLVISGYVMIEMVCAVVGLSSTVFTEQLKWRLHSYFFIWQLSNLLNIPPPRWFTKFVVDIIDIRFSIKKQLFYFIILPLLHCTVCFFCFFFGLIYYLAAGKFKFLSLTLSTHADILCNIPSPSQRKHCLRWLEIGFRRKTVKIFRPNLQSVF